MSPGSNIVLVADDDDDLRELLSEYLTSHGFDVIQAVNGLEALLHVKRNVLRAVVIDVSMPRLGGLEAIKRIRAFTPRTPVIVITGETDPDIEPRARELGAATVLSKPLDLASLLGVVRDGHVTEKVPALPTTAPPPAPPAAATSVPRGSLLLVDDDDAFREMLEELLAAKGYVSQSVGDAATALRVIEQVAPDVILLDVEMPGLNGVEALPAIRALAPRSVVVMVSGTSDAAMARRALIHGAFDYVTKPVDIVYLTRSIDAALMTKLLDDK